MFIYKMKVLSMQVFYIDYFVMNLLYNQLGLISNIMDVHDPSQTQLWSKKAYHMLGFEYGLTFSCVIHKILNLMTRSLNEH